jgi:hypothetical protein
LPYQFFFLKKEYINIPTSTSTNALALLLVQEVPFNTSLAIPLAYTAMVFLNTALTLGGARH